MMTRNANLSRPAGWSRAGWDEVWPQTFRNANFLRISISMLVLTLIFLAFGLVASPGAAMVFFGVAASFGVIAALYFASWRFAVLEVSRDGIRIRGIFRDRECQWNEIDRFVIRDPSLRTPFMLSFRPWADQARVVLRSGEVHRIRAVQPWHGFTALIYFTVIRPGPADDLVASLNELRHRFDSPADG